MMSKDEVVSVVEQRRKETIKKLGYFARAGVDVEGIYQDVAMRLITKDPAKLIADKLPGLLYHMVRNGCLDYLRLHGNDPERRVSYEPIDEILKLEIEVSERAREKMEADLDRELLLRRIPEALARTWRMHRREGYTWPEVAARRRVSVWTARRDLKNAEAAMRWIVENEWRLSPREHVESPRHKETREAIERRCARLRPAATKPTQCQGKERDPRTFWYGAGTIAWLDHMQEVAARVIRGEKHPYLKRRPLHSIDHKMYGLIEFAGRTKDEQEHRCTLPLAA